MKLSKLLGKSPTASAETALANLEGRRQSLEIRLADTKSRLDAARVARKQALEGDASADIAPLTRNVRDLEDEVDTLTGVLRDLADQTEAWMIKLDRARDDELRASSAKTLEDLATQIDTIAADLDKALRAAGQAANRMVAAMPGTLRIIAFSDSVPEGQNERERLTASVIADGLAHVFPSAFPVAWHMRSSGRAVSLARQFTSGTNLSGIPYDDIPDAMSAKAAAAEWISARLRNRAAEIVAGDAAPELDDITILPPPKPVKIYGSVEIFSLAHFSFKLEQRDAPRIVQGLWTDNVPEDVAAVAVKAGVALRTDTPEGAKALADRKAARAQSPATVSWSHQISLRDCVDLGVIRHPDVTDEAA